MLEYLKQEANHTLTENGADTYESTQSQCLDLFAAIGALRKNTQEQILERFLRAYAENADIAMKILFYARDVRGGLGERRVFRVILRWLADYDPSVVRKNITQIPAYGRYDDLLCLLDTRCCQDALSLIRTQIKRDLCAQDSVSLLAKWLPSVNASNQDTVRMAKRIARYLGMTDAQYRKTLARLREKIRIIENDLRQKDYSFDYEKQPSKALFKYRKAFLRNDEECYCAFLQKVQSGQATMHTGTLTPYEIIRPCFDGWCGVRANIDEKRRESMDATWNALKDFTAGENAIVVVDGSGSMYDGTPMPAAVALSLGIYFAQHSKGAFRDHFITFSQKPQLVKIMGRDILEKVCYCASYNEVANTDLRKVFELILHTALKHHVPQEELPARLYIVSDMEFDACVVNGRMTNFEYAKSLFARHGYRLPEVVFWNVHSRSRQQPVTYNQQGVALVSGCTPRLFSMVTSGIGSPYIVMMDILSCERYAPISA